MNKENFKRFPFFSLFVAFCVVIVIMWLRLYLNTSILVYVGISVIVLGGVFVSFHYKKKEIINTIKESQNYLRFKENKYYTAEEVYSMDVYKEYIDIVRRVTLKYYYRLLENGDAQEYDVTLNENFDFCGYLIENKYTLFKNSKNNDAIALLEGLIDAPRMKSPHNILPYAIIACNYQIAIDVALEVYELTQEPINYKHNVAEVSYSRFALYLRLAKHKKIKFPIEAKIFYLDTLKKQ